MKIIPGFLFEEAGPFAACTEAPSKAEIAAGTNILPGCLKRSSGVVVMAWLARETKGIGALMRLATKTDANVGEANSN